MKITKKKQIMKRKNNNKEEKYLKTQHRLTLKSAKTVGNLSVRKNETIHL